MDQNASLVAEVDQLCSLPSVGEKEGYHSVVHLQSPLVGEIVDDGQIG